MTRKINCLIIDDHAAVRVGLKMILEQSGVVICGEAGDGEAGAAMALKRRPDVIVLDVKMPGQDGFQTAKSILEDWPGAKILFFTAHSDRQFLKLGMEAGGMGYVLKDASGSEIERAVRQVAGGGIYVDGSLAHLLANPKATANLSPREGQVLGLLAQGMTSAEIAHRLHLSVETIRTHTRNSCHKLNATNRVQAVASAIHLGLIHNRP